MPNRLEVEFRTIELLINIFKGINALPIILLQKYTIIQQIQIIMQLFYIKKPLIKAVLGLRLQSL